MTSLPESMIYLFVRTSFSDASRWAALLAEVRRPGLDGLELNVEVVDDPQYAGLTSTALVALHPHRAEGIDVMYVADERTLTTDGFPLLVVRVGNEEEMPFRCRVDALVEVDANLSLANLDWEDFTLQIGSSGVYGTPDDVAPPVFPAERDEFDGAGPAAAQRIHDALLRGVATSGPRACVTVERRIPGERSTLFPYFEDPSGWLTSSGGGPPGQWYRIHPGSHHEPGSHWEQVGRIVPRGMGIECVVQDSVRPSFTQASWTWYREQPGWRESGSVAPVVAGQPMTIRFELDPAPRDEHWPMTRVRVVHDGVPYEIAHDLDVYWHWMLEVADHGFDLSGARAAHARPDRDRQIPPAE